MKRSEALDKLEDFINELIDNGYIHRIEVNGRKTVGTCLDIEDKVLSFVENKLQMSPPTENGIVYIRRGDPDDMVSYLKSCRWERE